MIRIVVKNMAIVLAAATMAVQSYFAFATARPLPAVTTGIAFPTAVDISSETRLVDEFGADLTRLEISCQDLAKKQSRTAVELSSTRTAAAGLKSRVSQIQQAFRSAINKLKAAGLWEKLDLALPSITEARAKRLIKQKGGPQKVLEEAASQLSGLSLEIDALIQPLGDRVRAGAGRDYEGERLPDLKSRAVRAAYDPSAAATIGFSRCMLRFGVFLLKPTDHNRAMGICACGSEPGDESYCPGGSNFSPR